MKWIKNRLFLIAAFSCVSLIIAFITGILPDFFNNPHNNPWSPKNGAYRVPIYNEDTDRETFFGGTLIDKYHYWNNGMTANVSIYDVKDQHYSNSEFLGTRKNSKYNRYPTDDFVPMPALATDVTEITDGYYLQGYEQSIVLYDKGSAFVVHLRSDLTDGNNYDRFRRIVKSFEFQDYNEYNLEREHNLGLISNYKSIQTWLINAIFLIQLLVLISAALKPSNGNMAARKSAVYFFVASICSMIAAWIIAYAEWFNCKLAIAEEYSNSIEIALICAAGTIATAVFAFLTNYLRIKSYSRRCTMWLIPDWVKTSVCRHNPQSIRAIYLFFFFPLFYVFPIPIIGWVIFLFYLLPLTVILLITWAVIWIKNGSYTSPETQNTEK